MMAVSTMAKPTLLVAQSKLASTPNTHLNTNRATFSGVGRSTLSRKCVVVRAADDDDDFEARLAALKKAKGETPYGAGAKKGKEVSGSDKPKIPMRDYSNETLYFESGPHMGDLAVNVALGTTLVWLPLSIAAVGRAAFVKYRFTDRRLSAITTAPWKNEQLDAAYDDVVDVKSIGRGVGYWGDMVVTLKDGSKVEMRAVPKYRELQQYILDRRDALKGSSPKTKSSEGGSGGGFS